MYWRQAEQSRYAVQLVTMRDWLAENHDTSGSVWAVTYKKLHPLHLPFGEVVEEVICWGWIDSSVRGVDFDRMMHLISPRSDGSAWSAVNKEIVARMRDEGRMMPVGEAVIAAARDNGMWGFLDDVERGEVPAVTAISPGSKTLNDRALLGWSPPR